MNDFAKKRDSLQQYIQEQIIGPGAYNKRFFFLDDWSNENFDYKDKVLTNEPAINNLQEVLPEVPAYQYSSAILFPKTYIKTAINIENNQSEIVNEDQESDNSSADDEDFNDNVTDNLVSKQQNYPSQLGISFVVNEDRDLKKDLLISLSFRKYKKYSQEECYKKRISIWCPEYVSEIKYAIQTYFSDTFQVIEVGSNTFITPSVKFGKDTIYEIDYINLNNYLNDILIGQLRKTFQSSLIALREKNGTTYWGIINGKEHTFFSIGDKEYQSTKYPKVITIFDNSIINYIETQLQESVENYSKLKGIIHKLEIYNQLKNIITDLKSIFKTKNPTPIWQSKPYKLNIELPPLDLSKIINRSSDIDVTSDNPDLKLLKYRVQYIRKNELVYVKLILINSFQIHINEDEPPQLNKKDNANLVSFFGVKLEIEECKEKTLLPYNPPQFLDFDVEDNFNKLIYRNFHDYGEGYNTSITWSIKDNRMAISTEFLPEQETPKVDFKPSKIVNNKVISRLSNENVLSFRYLSTLSSTTDNEIFRDLDCFIHDYYTWIVEKQAIINSEVPIQDRLILDKQINDCLQDYRRLDRNIKLLKSNSKAMAAFRLMNTSMFMQLYHNLEIKKGNINAVRLTENFYKELVTNTEYKWRSFQLAFILLNIDGFVQPTSDYQLTRNVFGSSWPERNEITDLIWFPTGGGKTEAYLGIIGFSIIYRRFVHGEKGYGTTAIMRYTLRMLTLEQFQRATSLICALETIRKDHFYIPNNYFLGDERISIGLFVGGGLSPNKWSESSSNSSSMLNELEKIANCLQNNNKITTTLPFTECPWCGSKLFIDPNLNNVYPNPSNPKYGITNEFLICCNNPNCTFHNKYPNPSSSLPFRLFDEDIYKFPPTLLFGTVDKFAAFANKISTDNSKRNEDSRRLLGYRGKERTCYPPELIIQDELHLLQGPLGTAVGLFEKGIDYLCSYEIGSHTIRPKIITSTATTRNTDQQIFALFNRRSEIFPKQGINCDDSFFAYYERDNLGNYISNRKYIGVLPIGKTQVWMQLRIASIALAHRLKFIKESFGLDQIFETTEFVEYIKNKNDGKNVLNYYHTVLSYFNSLKDVGKTQSQLNHYLPGDISYVIKNTMPWSFLDKLIRKDDIVHYSELTGRLTGEEVKTNKSDIESQWSLFESKDEKLSLKRINPPEFVISTNMISVGIDISRFNTMIISSMPRNIAEYIQATSRVARDKEGIVFTIHHPFRSRDISHYQRFKEFHEKFYSYVEPISVTPFASKALDRYLAALVTLFIRHNSLLLLQNNDDASKLTEEKKVKIKEIIQSELKSISSNAIRLDQYRNTKNDGLISNLKDIISDDEIKDVSTKLDYLLENWDSLLKNIYKNDSELHLKYRNENNIDESLFVSVLDDNRPEHWKVSHSLREIAPSTVITIVQQ